MPLLLLFIFVVVPIVEITLLIQVSDLIGTLPTIGLVILTAILGSILLRSQGLKVLERAQTALAEGRTPVESIVDGIGLLLAGALLLTPGVATDAVGFLLFMPGVRRAIAKWAMRNLMNKAKVTVFSSSGDFARGRPGKNTNAKGMNPHARPNPSSGPVIDGEFSNLGSERGPAPGEPTQSGESGTPWRPKK